MIRRIIATCLFISIGLLSIPEVSAATAPLKIMCVGDSITQGMPYHNSYRKSLYQLLKSNGYLFEMVGRKVEASNTGDPSKHYPYHDKPSNPASPWDPHHEGYSGHTSQQLITDLVGYTAIPDIVLLHIGTNDLARRAAGNTGFTLEKTIANVATIINNRLRNKNPQVTVLLAQVIPCGKPLLNTGSHYGGFVIDRYNARLAQLALQLSTPQSRIIVVDQFTGFPVSYLSDTWHPNVTQGEPLMATRWYAALKPLFETNIHSDSIVPTTPTNVVALGTTSSSIQLTWTASTDNRGISSYNIYRGTTLVGSSSTTNYVDSNLAANTTYSYKIQAKDAAGNVSATSALTNGKTLPNPVNPTFVMGINMNGGACIINGNAWLSYQTALTQGLSVTAPSGSSALLATSALTPSPAVDANTSAMLNSVTWSATSFTINQSLTTDGQYNVYLWMMENYQTNFRKINVSMEGGLPAATGLGQLAVGAWKRYGPYPVNMTDGTLNITLTATQGNPSIMGFEIYRVANPTAVASLSTWLSPNMGMWNTAIPALTRP